MGVNDNCGLLVYFHGLGEYKTMALASYAENLDFIARTLVWKK